MVGDGFDQLVAGSGSGGQQVALWLGLGPRKTAVVDIEVDRHHAHEVDHAGKAVLGTDRDLDSNRISSEAIDDCGLDVREVGANAIHLVDEGDARHAVLVGLAPDGLGLGLNTSNRVEDGDSTIEHAQRALHFNGEVHVPGCIDDVDAMTAPQRRRGSRGNRDAALLLLDHPVHGCATLVHLAQLVGAARVEQDALGDGGLARIDVGHDADVAVQVQLVGARGGGLSLCLDNGSHVIYQR